jgi:alpha-tubulin suppressor-like RCC1 family protein
MNRNQLLLATCLLLALQFRATAGTVVAWGTNSSGQLNVPPSVTNAAAIAGGYNHSLALNADGTVAVWGGQPAIPSYLHVTNVTGIAAGGHMSLALRADGTVYQWGSGTLPSPPASLSNVMSVEMNRTYISGASSDGCLALKRDGTVAGWANQYLPINGEMYGANSATMVAAGLNHALALEADGSVMEWSDYFDYGNNWVPAILSNTVVAVAAGVGHSLALTTDGTVVAWGTRYSPYGIGNVPAGLNNVVAIAAGPYHNLALKSDGTVVGWGRNDSGQTNVPAGLSNVVAVNGGYGHSLALVDPTPLAIVRQPQPVTALPRQAVLLSVGVVSQTPVSYQWQFNGTDIPDATNAFYRLAPLVFSELGNYRVVVSNTQAVVTSRTVPVAMAGNTVVSWGENRFANTNVPMQLRATVLAAGGASSLALQCDGTVAVWGWNQYNQTNVPSGLSNVVGIAAGYAHELAVKADGKVTAWGLNNWGQTSVPATLSNVVAVSAGEYHSLALQLDGTVAQWGLLTGGRPLPPAGLNSVIAIASGNTHGLALKCDGTVTTWGSAAAVPSGLSNVVAISGGADFSLALKSDGTVTAWGQNSDGQCTVPSGLGNVVAIAAGYSHAIALTSDGTAVAWGLNYWGQTNIPAGLSNLVSVAAGDFHNVVGIGATDPAIARQPPPLSFLSSRTLLSVGAVSSRPVSYRWQHKGVDVPGATNATLELFGYDLSQTGLYCVVVSNELGCVVSAPARVAISDNRVVAWGSNTSGQTNVPAGLNATAVVGGSAHSLALQLDGSVVGWGDNLYKQINIPSSATNVVQLAAGGIHNLALRADGTLVAWGILVTNQASVPSGFSSIAAGGNRSLAVKGDGAMMTWASPLLTGPTNLPRSNIVAIATSGGHRLAAKSDGTVIAEGANSYGQCTVPAGLSNVAAIAAGGIHSLALKADGNVVAWGDNYYGQCNVPTNLTNAVAIAASSVMSMALKRDGTLAVWGRNDYGQLTLPVGLSNVVSIATGDSHCLAVMDPRDPLVVRQPCSASAFSGNPVLFTAGVRSVQPLAFQWQFNGISIPGATDAWLSLPAVQAADVGAYSVVASNALGLVVSSEATLTVLDRPPFILTQPVDAVISNNPPARLQVVADGSGPLSYLWQKDGAAVAESTAATLTLPTPHRADSGYYSVTVSNMFGTATSTQAKLRVLVPQTITGPFFQSGGGLVLQARDSDGGLLTDADAAFFQLWASTNLSTWELLSTTATVTNGALWLQDYMTTNYPQRFYRLVERP